MKALLSTTAGGPETLQLADVAAPRLEANRVLIDVKACAVNFADLLIIRDQYQMKAPRPFAPGAEIAGIVAAVGEGVQGLKRGDRVVALLIWGGMAEQVSVDSGQVLVVPHTMPFEDAAALLCTFGTSYFGLKQRARLQAGERLLVLGAAGGVGIAAVQLGIAMGASVVAVVSTPEKGQFCKSQGAHAVVISAPGPLDGQQQREFLAQLREAGSGGFDVIYDPVGGSYAEPAIRCLNRAGRYLVVGFAAGDIPRVPLNLALLKNADLLGVWWGEWTERNPESHRQNIAELLDLYQRSLIRPHVSERFPLAEGGEALRRLEARRAMGKILVTMGGP